MVLGVMRATERPTFESEASKVIYEYVERHGTAKRNVLLDVAPVPSDEFRTELDRLKSRGYLEEDGGTLQLALDVGTIEEHDTDAGIVTIRPGRQRDFEGLIDAIRDVTSEETYVVAETIAEQLLYDEAVTRHNRVESRVFFVATLGEEVVGWTHLDSRRCRASARPPSRPSASRRTTAGRASAASCCAAASTGPKPTASGKCTTASR
jgi:hypothetical protein